MTIKGIVLFSVLLYGLLPVHGQYYEVPGEVKGLTSPVLSLNGTWRFDTVFRKEMIGGDPAEGQWRPIRVPGEWVMQGFTVKPGTPAAYYREFEVPSSWKGKTVMLRCDALFSRAEVWVNGRYAGAHLGGMTPLELEVTSFLRAGKRNHILVAVTAETIADTLMSGSQYAAHSLGGILRKIYLYALPQVFAGDLRITTGLDDSFTAATLEVSGVFHAPEGRKNAAVSFRLFDPDGEEVPLPPYEGRLLYGKGDKEIRKVFRFPLDPVQTWDPEHPRLYRLVLTVTADDDREVITRRVGFRRLQVVGNKLFLNGRPLKMRGVNRHETHPLLGRSLNDTLWRLDAELFKAGNVNYIRTSHYPPAEEFVAWCDSLGLLVELENPFCWIGHGANAAWKKADPQAPSLYAFLEHTAAEVIAFYRNHPSVTIWSMANESAWGPNWEKLLHFYQTTDASRPVSFHDQAYGGYNNYGSGEVPVAVYHYPGPDGGRVADTFARPLLFGEYCHINCYNRQEIAADPGVRDAWGRGFLPMWDRVYESPGALGGAIWAGIDDVFYLPEGRAVGYGEWGVIDGWRRKKPEYYHMKKTYAPVRVINKKIKRPRQGETAIVEIENRFDFTDLKECRIRWQINGKEEEALLPLPPHQTGILRIPLPADVKEGDRMALSFFSPQGQEVERTIVTLGSGERHALPVTAGGGKVSLDSTEHFYLIRGEGYLWKVGRREGLITAVGENGDTLLSDGPQLMMLPLKTGPCVTDYQLEIPPLNNLCRDRKARRIEAVIRGDTVKIAMRVRWYEAHGTVVYLFLPGGRLTVRYELVSDIKIDPRQWGMVFSVPRRTEKLAWERRGLWSCYPDDHIGRTEGETLPFPEGKYIRPAFGQDPGHPWKDDANALGTNDFRSSKERICWASLTDETGRGVLTDGDGENTFRAWVHGEHISFLVAGFSTGGGDLFFSSHYRNERRPLKRGDRFSGMATIILQIP